eukprot:g22649.t1
MYKLQLQLNTTKKKHDIQRNGLLYSVLVFATARRGEQGVQAGEARHFKQLDWCRRSTAHRESVGLRFCKVPDQCP